jgi:hypothetical protein
MYSLPPEAPSEYQRGREERRKPIGTAIISTVWMDAAQYSVLSKIPTPEKPALTDKQRT